MLGFDDISVISPVGKADLAGDDIRLIPEIGLVKGQKAKACSRVHDRLLTS